MLRIQMHKSDSRGRVNTEHSLGVYDSLCLVIYTNLCTLAFDKERAQSSAAEPLTVIAAHLNGAMKNGEDKDYEELFEQVLQGPWDIF